MRDGFKCAALIINLRVAVLLTVLYIKFGHLSTFVVGVSGATINIGSVQLKGMAFAAIVGVFLSLIFWILDKFGVMNKE